MPDNKLTDSEIVKALECCNVSGLCNECPVKKDFNVCHTIDKLAIDLINRLQEKNSNLTSDLTSLQNDLTSLQAENKRLKKENHHFADIGKMYSEVKADAYKEFAERLKEWFRKESETYKLIDKLLKEMVGE